MSNPEKHRKDDSNLNPPPPEDKAPEMDAIVPDEVSPSESLDDIDDYQRKLDAEWQTAKESYEQKINQIMDDFLKDAPVQDAENPLPPPPSKSKVPPLEKPRPQLPDKKKDVAELSHLLSRVEKVLKHEQRRPRLLPRLGNIAPPIINMSQQPQKLFSKFNMILMTIVLATSAALWYFLLPFHIEKITPLPYQNTTGPIIQNDRVYIADWFRKAIYVHQLRRGLPIISVENIPNKFITGFAFSQEGWWTLDGFSNKIVLHNSSIDHRIVESVKAPGSKPVGMFFDGYDVWTADNVSKKLFQHHSRDLEDIKKTYEFPDKLDITAFQIHKNRAWVLAGDSREVNIYRLQNPMRLLASFDLDPFLKGARPTGMALKDKTIWLTTINPPQVIRIKRKDLEKSSTDDF